MKKSDSQAYKDAGVDITAGYESVKKIKPLVESTYKKGVLGSLGGFGGAFEIDTEKFKEPVLISGTDGVGTKLKLAFLLDKHNTIGIDCVAMCVNDIVCSGAQPEFFLDYIACGKNYPEKIKEIVEGITEGCKQAQCALVGGETAEMPDFYDLDEYDLAGFSVGVVDKSKIIDNKDLSTDDILIGLPSSGPHSNGFSLIRKIFDVENTNLNEPLKELNGKTLGEVLLEPTKIYVKPVLELLNNNIPIHAISHITGGGFYENVPRMLNDEVNAVIYKETLPKLPVFDLIQEKGNISEDDMYNTFNMGVGMVIAVPEEKREEAIEALNSVGADPIVIGAIESGNGEVILK